MLGAQLPSASQGVRPLITVGYYVDHDDLSLVTVQRHGELFSTIITTNFDIVDTMGTVKGVHDPDVVAAAREQGISVHFRIANVVDGTFRRDIAHAVLTRAEARERAIAGILQVLDRYGYDGVNIDLENIPAGDRQALTSFVRELATAVRERGRTVSIAVPARTEDDPTDDWAGAFHLRTLGQIVDFVVLMAYDEHWDTSPPGPVASLPWVESVVRFAVTQVSREKLLLGVALYGYAWPRSGGPATALSGRQAAEMAAREGVAVRWNDRARVPYFTTRNWTVYFENARSVWYKTELAARYGLAGISVWRLGHELPDVWDTVTAFVPRPRPVMEAGPPVSPRAVPSPKPARDQTSDREGAAYQEVHHKAEAAKW
jgi:spore germination protein YaaH